MGKIVILLFVLLSILAFFSPIAIALVANNIWLLFLFTISWIPSYGFLALTMLLAEIFNI